MASTANVFGWSNDRVRRWVEQCEGLRLRFTDHSEGVDLGGAALASLEPDVRGARRASVDRMAFWRSRFFLERPVLLGATIWLLLGAAGVLLIFSLTAGNRDRASRLTDHGVTTLATVTKTEPENHNLVSYDYVVGGLTYHDRSSAAGPDGLAGDLKVGDRIHIVYDTADPTSSCNCNPSELARNNGPRSALFGGFGVTSIMSIGLTVTLVRKHRKSGPTS